MSLRVRLLAAFAYVIVLVLIALVVPLALNLSNRVDAEIKTEARGQAQIVAASAAGRLERTRELERLADTASQDLGGRVIVVDRRGQLLADSSVRGTVTTSSYLTRPEIARALKGDTAQGERHSDSLGEDLLFTAVPVLDRGRIEGAVRVTQSVESVNSEVRSDVLALVAVGLAALGLGLLVAWIIAGTLARPERELAATARQIAGGDLDARARANGSSEQREVAEAFNEMTDRLARSLAAQREFAGNASHQLRTPLTGLRLRLEAAAMKAEGDADLKRDLEAGEREVERLSRTVTALLALAREGETSPPDTAVSLGTCVEEAAARWQGVVGNEGRSLELRTGPNIKARAAGDDVAVILDNLIENALRHAPEAGEVTLEWGDDGGYAWLAVSDDGPGIDPDHAERFFDRFYSGNSHPGQNGSGLGLAIVRTLAERWGGEARLENRPGGGARAFVRLRSS